MEIYDSNPKSFSQSKRSQKYSDPKEKRKAHPNGQQVRKVIYENHYSKNSTQFKFEKSVRNPSIESSTGHYRRGNRAILFAQTDFEKGLNTQMLTDLDYSLNRHKNWEKIDELIENVKADEKCTVEQGKKQFGDRECEVVKLAYFDMEDMQTETDKLIRQQKKYEKALNYDVTDINNYIKDKFYDTIIHKTDKAALRKWRQIQNVKPRNISKRSHFIPIKSISARSIKKGCKLRCATVKSFGIKSYWSPIKNDDARDYIQLDLGKNCLIEAVSTRGRVLKRANNYEIDHARSFVEYVKKYKVMIKKDDGLPVTKRSSKNNCKNKANKDDNKANNGIHNNDQFISLGIFNGNCDSESEVANKLRLPNDNKYGVIARYLRIYPLNHHGRKSMRVGVYGNHHYEQRDHEKLKVSVDNENDNITDDNNGELMHNANVPAAIITITKPSETYNRNCWAVNHRVDGVASCSCYGCKWWKFEGKFKRKDMRCYFRKQTKDINRIQDYSLDRDAIIYYSRRR